MSLLAIAQMTDSKALRGRCIAALASTQPMAGQPADALATWWWQQCWHVCSAPGWADSWDYAELAKPGANHGADKAVITDAQIVSAVEGLLNQGVSP